MAKNEPPGKGPTIHVIAGPNGAGKTTFAHTFLPEFGCLRFLNADSMAAGLFPLTPAAGAIRGARLLLSEWDVLVKAGDGFSFETTMSGKAYVARLSHAKERGYNIHIHYLWLPTVSLALRRIRQRVKKGGHHVPAPDVKRRFQPSLENFFRLYLPLANAATIFDGSGRPPKLVAEYQKGDQIIHDAQTYERIQQTIP